MWPLAVACAYVFGFFLLNFYYYVGWGLWEMSYPTALSTVAAVIALLTVLIACVLKYLGNKFIEWVERKPLRRKIVGLVAITQALYWVYATMGGHSSIPPIRVQSIRITAELGRLIIALVWYGSIVYFVMILIAAWPKRKNIEPSVIIPPSGFRIEDVSCWRKCVIFVFRVLLVPALFVGVLAGFIDVYDVIGSRFGGGRPDPLLLWVSPQDLPAIDALSWEHRNTACPASSAAVYRGLSLVYEEADYLILAKDGSAGTIHVSKELVKRRQWVSDADKGLLNRFDKEGINRSILCGPVSSSGKTN